MLIFRIKNKDINYLKIAKHYESTIKKYKQLVIKKRKELSSATTECSRLDMQRKIKFYEHLFEICVNDVKQILTL